MEKRQVPRDLHGNVISPLDLPPANTVRWVPNRKYIVLQAIKYGLISRADVLTRYKMTDTELSLWEKGFDDFSAQGLRSNYQKNRRRS